MVWVLLNPGWFITNIALLLLYIIPSATLHNHHTNNTLSIYMTGSVFDSLKPGGIHGPSNGGLIGGGINDNGPLPLKGVAATMFGDRTGDNDDARPGPK